MTAVAKFKDYGMRRPSSHSSNCQASAGGSQDIYHGPPGAASVADESWTPHANIGMYVSR